MDKKICPICQNELEEIETYNKYGLKIRIDRCPLGCGFWFDQFELYQVSTKEVIELSKELKGKDFDEKEKLLCPVCRIEMKKIRTTSFSYEIVLDYCTGCSGIWLDKERLLRYKRLQEEKANKAFKELLKSESSKFDRFSEEDAWKALLKFIFKLYL